MVFLVIPEKHNDLPLEIQGALGLLGAVAYTTIHAHITKDLTMCHMRADQRVAGAQRMGASLPGGWNIQAGSRR